VRDGRADSIAEYEVPPDGWGERRVPSVQTVSIGRSNSRHSARRSWNVSPFSSPRDALFPRPTRLKLASPRDLDESLASSRRRDSHVINKRRRNRTLRRARKRPRCDHYFHLQVLLGPGESDLPARGLGVRRFVCENAGSAPCLKRNLASASGNFLPNDRRPPLSQAPTGGFT
jgi:hypothetical protein